MRVGLLVLALLVVGCGASHNKPDDGSYDDNSGFISPLPDPLEASTSEDDSGALDIGGRANDGGTTSDGGHGVDLDGGAPVACTGPLAAGDVKIVEMMIASASGSADCGEWVELESTRTCILNINGLVVQSPRGTLFDKASVTVDTFIAPGASFLVADSASTTDNHSLPNAAVVATWNTYDVLKNGGDTIDVYAGTTLVDTLTYPAFTLVPGRSVAFPADCAWSDRASWARWSMSFNVWSSPYQGTPGADNSDVSCY